MEMIYQYIWKTGMLGRYLQTVDGRRVDVIRPGVLNTDSGPDFLDARLRIDGQEWAGNVEVHVRASDWFLHGHDTDPAYDNVILHIVSRSDRAVMLRDGRRLPQVVVNFPESFSRLYLFFAQRISEVPCEAFVPEIPALNRCDWIMSLGVERLRRKSDDIFRLVEKVGGDWHHACLAALARGLGFNINSDPMEMLVRSIPFNFLMRHSDNPLQIEALLFGQAGMLDAAMTHGDPYCGALWREYMFLRSKYSLRPLETGIWKFARTRPQNFPHRRIALLAAAVKGGFSLLSELLNSGSDPERVRKLFDWSLGGYWESHFSFDTPGRSLPLHLSKESVDLLLINFVAPMVYAVGVRRGDPELSERGISLWESLAPERNRYILQWKRAGLIARNAFETQGLLQLRREYCDRARCMECRFGHYLLRRELQKNQFTPARVNK